jgi:hypothetical protein
MIKKLIYISSIAIIIFFAISFLTVLVDFGNPFWESSTKIDVGFPFTYYEDFFLDFKHHEWNLTYLIIDAFIIWILVFVIWKFKK